MNHKEAFELLPAYLDNELGISEAIALEQHLENCTECQQEFSAQSTVSTLLKKEAPSFKAPAHLAHRIQAALPRERSRRVRFKAWNFNWLNAGAVMVSLLALVWTGNLFLMLPSAEEQLTTELISSHIRSQQADHLTDVISSDRHTVKPWFNGKLDFSPPITDLAPQGFPLVGGRLDYIDGRTVAVLIYRRNQHPINLYIWPDSAQSTPLQAQSIKGYHLLRWTANGMNYWAISDVAANELETFVNLFSAQI